VAPSPLGTLAEEGYRVHRGRSRRRPTATVRDMIEAPRCAPGAVACGRSGLPLLATCPAGHRRTVPFRLLKTSESDRTPLYGRPFRCKACGSPEVTLSAIEDQIELAAIQRALAGPPKPAEAPTTYRPPDPNRDLL
jgi:hypothetical protein